MRGPTLADRLAGLDAARFAGRRAELARFDALLVEEPETPVVLLHGPGGIGKSTLLREVLRRAVERGFSALVVEGRELDPVPGELERALAPMAATQRPLLVFDTWERMSALGSHLRAEVLPALPAGALVVLAGRRAPEPEWFRDGWEHLCVAMELAPLDTTDAVAVLRAHGLEDAVAASRAQAWAQGSPLALALAADAARDGAWKEREERPPELVDALVHRLGGGELDDADLDVLAVAALARTTTKAMLAEVLPDIDAEAAYAWLRERTVAETVGGGVTLHDLLRRALADDLRAQRPERDRELRLRIADHLHARAIDGRPRLIVDLVDLCDDEAITWALGAGGAVGLRVERLRADDIDELAARIAEQRPGRDTWLKDTVRLLHVAPQLVIVARDEAGVIAGFTVVTRADAVPAAALDDPILGPWSRWALEHTDPARTLVWRDVLDLTVRDFDASSRVPSVLSTAGWMATGVVNPRVQMLPIDPANEVAVQFARAAGAVDVPELRYEHNAFCQELHVADLGKGGMLGATRDAVRGSLGLPPLVTTAEPTAAAPAGPAATGEITSDTVREALRVLGRPGDLARSPLAVGETPAQRAASVRATIERAAREAFGTGEDERLLREVLERGYLAPASTHEQAADALFLSRATYFRRLRQAADRVADWVLAERGGGAPAE